MKDTMTSFKSLPLIRSLQSLCAGYFAFDVSYEAMLLFRGEIAESALFLLHLVFEVLAIAFLLSSFYLNRHYQTVLRRFGEHRDRTVTAFRAHFDDLISARFDEWGLSAAERDVALLSLRGLRIAEIAKARGTRDGTIKAQISAAFHKAGVGTRAEFLALFMDEFLDFGIETDEDDLWIEAEESLSGTMQSPEREPVRAVA